MGQQKDKDSDLLIAVLLAGLVLGVVGGLAIAGFAYPIYKSEKWAAWVQAIGSILALVGVYWATKRQAQAAISQVHAENILEKKNNLDKVFLLVGAVRELMQKIKEELNSKKVDSLATPEALQISILLESSTERHLIRPLADTLKSIETSSIGSKEVALEVVRLGLYLNGLELYVSKALAGPWRNPDMKKMLDQLPENKRFNYVMSSQKILNNNLINHLDFIQSTCDKLIKELQQCSETIS